MMGNKNIQNRLAPLCGGEKKGEISLSYRWQTGCQAEGDSQHGKRGFYRFGGWGTENYVGSLDEVFTSKKGVVLTEKDIQRLAKGSWDKVLSVSPVARPV
ncbi:hypothetical protein CMK14_09115 [Candidatus Poribacteria bacterium]|nr:hypothetical protein [Candidatus Poribacteria bacterium]